MIYKMTLADSSDTMTFNLLEVPIVDKDIEGAVDNTTLDGNVFTDYLYLKKQWTQKWSIMSESDYTKLRGFYTRQFATATPATYTLFYVENGVTTTLVPTTYVRINLSDGGVIDTCGDRRDVQLIMRETIE